MSADAWAAVGREASCPGVKSKITAVGNSR